MLINFQEIIANKKKIVTTVAILVLALSVIFLSAECIFQALEIHKLKKELSAQQTNVKIVGFLDTFIKKVLQAQGEVSFEDRLKLETAIRDLNDKEVLDSWEKFTQAQTTEQVQQTCKDLLELLVTKILR